MKRNGQYLNVYVNDNIFENGQLVQEKSKSVWLKWAEALALRDAISTAEEQVICLEINFLLYFTCIYYSIQNTRFSFFSLFC